MNNYEYASRLQRFLNWTIDGLIITILWFVLFNLVVPYLIQMGIFDWMKNGETYNLTFTILIIYFLYYLILEGFFKTTIGKLITRTKLMKPNGGQINFGNVITRTICRFIPFELLSYLSKNPVGFHDSLSNTGVFGKKVIQEGFENINN